VIDVTVTLTADEDLVLFEMLHCWEDADPIDPMLLPPMLRLSRCKLRRV
jgi:hypothetical protein